MSWRMEGGSEWRAPGSTEQRAGSMRAGLAGAPRRVGGLGVRWVPRESVGSFPAPHYPPAPHWVSSWQVGLPWEGPGLQGGRGSWPCACGTGAEDPPHPSSQGPQHVLGPSQQPEISIPGYVSSPWWEAVRGATWAPHHPGQALGAPPTQAEGMWPPFSRSSYHSVHVGSSASQCPFRAEGPKPCPHLGVTEVPCEV